MITLNKEVYKIINNTITLQIGQTQISQSFSNVTETSEELIKQ